MNFLELSFLGSPLIVINGTPVNQRIDKGIALLALLAVHSSKLPRDTLSASLWTGSDPAKARGALRTAIWRLKDSQLSPWLESDQEYVTLQKNGNVWIDIEEFQSILESANQPPHHPTCTCPVCTPLLERAISLYRGDFMAGYSPRKASGFDDWRAQIGQHLHDEYMHALARLAKAQFTQEQYNLAVQTTRLWLSSDPYNEEAHALFMRSLAQSNQTAGAITHFRAYKRLINKKQGILPGQEITTLYKHLLRGKNPPLTPSQSLLAPGILLIDIANIADLRTHYDNRIENEVVRYTNLVNESVQHFGGRVIKQNIDNLTIYFDQGQPLMFALALYRQISRTRWGIPEPLSIRMVITTILNRQGSYPEYSPELISCRQLLQSASGGQILLTEPAVNNLEFPNASRAHNLGSFLLAGQSHPTQVYLLIHPHLPGVEPHTLANLVRSPSNIPIQSTRFVGREAELNQINQLLSQPEIQLISLVGPGGVGKTRLGIQVISQLHPTPPDGIFFVSLVAHQNPFTIYQPIAEALHLSFNSLSDPAMQLIEHLRSRQLLLLLDNFEHLLLAKYFVLALLEGAPGVKIILTSRERLNVPSESLIEVHGFAVPSDHHDPGFEQFSGIKLFTQNARRVSPGFVLRQEDKPHIIQIISQVGGLPLGIELSSAWVRAYSCQEIASSIAQNLDFIQSSSPDIPTRHRSLRAAFDHSWRLLSEEDRRTLSKLSIYRNGFSAQAADQLANANPTILASYVEKNMLAQMAGDRFLMLETLRMYALENLKADQQEYDHLLDAHSDYFLNFLIEKFASFAGETGAALVKEIWLDTENFRDAINRAIEREHWSLLTLAIGPLMAAYDIQGRFMEGHEHNNAIIKQLSDQTKKQVPELYYLLYGWNGHFSFRLGFSHAAMEKMRISMEFAQSQGNLVLAANFLMLMADAHRRHGDYETALQEITQSVAWLASAITDENTLLTGFYANALSLMGVIQHRVSQFEAAHQTLSLCLAALEKTGARYVRIRALDLQARLAVTDQKYQEAFDLRQEALAIAEEFNDHRNIAIMLNNLGDSAEQLGDNHGAYTLILKANRISSETGDQQLQALTSNNLGLLSLQQNNLPDAIQYYHKSLDMYRRIRNTLGTFLTLRDTSRAHLRVHDLENARLLISEALQLGSELGKPNYVFQLLSVIANLLAQTGRTERAIQLCSIILDHPDTGSFTRNETQQLLAEISPQTTEPGTSLPDLAPGLPTFESLLAEL